MNRVGLHRDDAEFHAEGNFTGEFRGSSLQLFAHGDDIAARCCGYTETDRGVAVKSQQLPRRFLVTAPDVRDIAQINLCAAARSGNKDVCEVLFGIDHFRRADGDQIRPDIDGAAIRYDVLQGKFPGDRGSRNP